MRLVHATPELASIGTPKVVEPDTVWSPGIRGDARELMERAKSGGFDVGAVVVRRVQPTHLSNHHDPSNWGVVIGHNRWSLNNLVIEVKWLGWTSGSFHNQDDLILVNASPGFTAISLNISNGRRNYAINDGSE